jgi:hypothetical protein
VDYKHLSLALEKKPAEQVAQIIEVSVEAVLQIKKSTKNRD